MDFFKKLQLLLSDDNPGTLWLRNIKSEIIRYFRQMKAMTTKTRVLLFVNIKQG